MAAAHSHQRYRQWSTAATTLAGANFPFYGAEAWPRRLGGSRAQNGQCTEVTVSHYDTPNPDARNGDRPRLTVPPNTAPSTATGRCNVLAAGSKWLCADEEATRWQDASRAAITVWLRRRARERRAQSLVLHAPRST